LTTNKRDKNYLSKYQCGSQKSEWGFIGFLMKNPRNCDFTFIGARIKLTIF